MSGIPKPWSANRAEKSWAPVKISSLRAPVRHESPPPVVASSSLDRAIADLDKVVEEIAVVRPTMASASLDNEKAIDDLTDKLVRALDTNDVVDWEPNDTPFGNCEACGCVIDGEASVVGKFHYHPKCFTCYDCKRPLGTSKYYIIDGKKYCSKDKMKFLESCAKCGLIIENETIRPKDNKKPYHPECFCCSKCGCVLQGRYFNTKDGATICEEDYVASRDKCTRCARPIMESTLKALGEVYHPDCFICSMCPKSLDGRQFFVTEDNKPMCQEDYMRFIAKTCDGCSRKITDEKLISTNIGKYFHQGCYQRQ